MKSFEPGFLERQPIPPALLQAIRRLGEYKGRQDLYKQQSPQVLRTLQGAAVIQNTVASNRIEGVVAPPDDQPGPPAISPQWRSSLCQAWKGCDLGKAAQG